VVADGETLHFGKFELTFVESQHSPGDRYPGSITSPLKPPARAGSWKTGTTWSVLIRYEESRTILVHGSANFRAGALKGRSADVVYLGLGHLGRQSDAFVDAYWNEVVRATGATRVIVMHWDDFFRSLDEPLRPMPSVLDPVQNAMRRILERGARDGVEVLSPVAWERVDPFAGLMHQS